MEKAIKKAVFAGHIWHSHISGDLYIHFIDHEDQLWITSTHNVSEWNFIQIGDAIAALKNGAPYSIENKVLSTIDDNGNEISFIMDMCVNNITENK